VRQETIGGAAAEEEVSPGVRTDSQVDDDGEGTEDENGVGDGSSGDGPAPTTGPFPPVRFGVPAVSLKRRKEEDLTEKASGYQFFFSFFFELRVGNCESNG
jgi:hypothetical protein